MAGAPRWPFVAGPALAGLGWMILYLMGLPAAACWCAAVTVLCGTWWVFQPIAIPATSLIPFAVFPLTGVLNHQSLAACFGNPIILLVIGGLILSTAMERSGAHRRLALGILRGVGRGDERRVVLGYLLTASLMSMWISNTATTLILLPVALATLEQVQDRTRLAVPLLLGVAYGATIGGIGTPVGSATNLMFMAAYQETTGVELNFWNWMTFGVPMVAVMLPVTWLWLTRRIGHAVIASTMELGPWRVEERRVLSVVVLAAVAWMTRTAPWGGWSALSNVSGAGDDTVALAAIVALFVLPDGRGRRLLDWNTAKNIPWGVPLLLAGGIAIARAFESSGLSQSVGVLLAQLGNLPVILMIFIICLVVTFMTEVTSNTATTAVLMPILAAAGTSANSDPILLMAPAVVSASCAFMLPAATSPNAVVFSLDVLTPRQMAREGLVLNLIGVPITTAICYLVLSR